MPERPEQGLARDVLLVCKALDHVLYPLIGEHPSNLQREFPSSFLYHLMRRKEQDLKMDEPLDRLVQVAETMETTPISILLGSEVHPLCRDLLARWDRMQPQHPSSRTTLNEARIWARTLLGKRAGKEG